MWKCEPRHDKTNKIIVRPAKTQISLGIRPVWSESSLSAWRRLGSLATHWADSEDSVQTGRMPRLIWVFAGRTAVLLVLSYPGSCVFTGPFDITGNHVIWTGTGYHARVWRLRVTLAWRPSNGIVWRHALYMVEILFCFFFLKNDFLTKKIQITDLNMWQTDYNMAFWSSPLVSTLELKLSGWWWSLGLILLAITKTPCDNL